MSTPLETLLQHSGPQSGRDLSQRVLKCLEEESSTTCVGGLGGLALGAALLLVWQNTQVVRWMFDGVFRATIWLTVFFGLALGLTMWQYSRVTQRGRRLTQ